MRDTWWFRWLLEDDDVPWGIQLFWKFLALSMATTLILAAVTSQLLLWQEITLYLFASLSVFFGLFCKLGS